jgi:hypothetical protein
VSDWIRVFGHHFSDPKVWVTLIVFVSLFLAWLLYALLGDFYPRRRRKTRHILGVASKFREAGSESRTFLARRLIGYVESRDQFTSCYAANVVSRLALEFPEEASGMIDALGALLLNDDLLRRHAAAQSLYRLGPAARSEREQIQRAAEAYQQESTGAIAARLIQQLDDPSAWRTDSSR